MASARTVRRRSLARPAPKMLLLECAPLATIALIVAFDTSPPPTAPPPPPLPPSPPPEIPSPSFPPPLIPPSPSRRPCHPRRLSRPARRQARLRPSRRHPSARRRRVHGQGRVVCVRHERRLQLRVVCSQRCRVHVNAPVGQHKACPVTCGTCPPMAALITDIIAPDWYVKDSTGRYEMSTRDTQSGLPYIKPPDCAKTQSAGCLNLPGLQRTVASNSNAINSNYTAFLKPPLMRLHGDARLAMPVIQPQIDPHGLGQHHRGLGGGWHRLAAAKEDTRQFLECEYNELRLCFRLCAHGCTG